MFVEEIVEVAVGANVLMQTFVSLFGKDCDFVKECRSKIREIGKTLLKELNISADELVRIADDARAGPKTQGLVKAFEEWLENRTKPVQAT